MQQSHEHICWIAFFRRLSSCLYSQTLILRAVFYFSVLTGKTDTETLLGKTPTHGLTPKGSEDNKKELASETFKDVQMRNRGLRESMSPNTLNGSSESSKAGIAGDRRSSPWNIQLKKVEKKVRDLNVQYICIDRLFLY